ncbi:hypothetical protein BDD12DRAFT_809716 [Trichophaea hybrida]|nr:hypothetical protein BDD12DRAFT_809716 [Trichophaea hybrida]
MQFRLQYLLLLVFALLLTSTLASPHPDPYAEAEANALAEAEAEAEPQDHTPPTTDPEHRPDTPKTLTTFRHGAPRNRCKIIPRNTKAACRWCPFNKCPIRKRVRRTIAFDCWYYSGSEVSGVGYWDKTSDGCWVNESRIEDGCWHNLPKCKDKF